MSKRRPGTDLNHDNWNQEEEPEEKGDFKKASEEQLKERKIITARRKQKPATDASPFGTLNLLSTGTVSTAASVAPMPSFSFNFGTPAANASTLPMPKFDFSAISNGSSSDKKNSEGSSTTSTQKADNDKDNSGAGSNDKAEPTPSPTTPATTSPVQSQCNKRRSETDLNRDNWDQDEDEEEEKGEFKKASEEQLKERKIITAKRKSTVTETKPSNPFSGVSLLSAATPTTQSNTNNGGSPSMFNFSTTTNAPDTSAQAPISNAKDTEKESETGDVVSRSEDGSGIISATNV